MQVIDISMTIHEAMIVYKNREAKKPKVKTVATHGRNGIHESEICFNLHTGTHIDAPLHMIDGGETIGVYDPERFFNEALVLDLTHVEDMVSAEDLKDQGIREGDFVLLKTRNSFEDFFNTAWISVDASGADFLAEAGVRGVGIDALGIERAQADHHTHRTLLKDKIMILEGIVLKDVAPGRYELVVMPLKLDNLEGAPARAVLVRR